MTQCGTSVTRDFLGKIVHRFDRGSEAGSCNAHIEVSIMHELACMLVSDVIITPDTMRTMKRRWSAAL